MYDTNTAYNNVYAYITQINNANNFTVNYAYTLNTLTGIDKIDTQTITVTSGDLIGVNVNTNSTEIFKRVNKKNFNYNIVIENSLRDNSQK